SVDSAFLFRLNVYTGRTNNVASAPLRFGGFLVDHDGHVRYAVGQQEDNSLAVLRREGDSWETVHQSEMGGAMRVPQGFDRENKRVYFAISESGEPPRIALVDPETQHEQLLSRNANVEPSDYLDSADQRSLLAIAYEDGLPSYDFVDAEHPESKVYAGLIKAFPEHAVR